MPLIGYFSHIKSYEPYDIDSSKEGYERNCIIYEILWFITGGISTYYTAVLAVTFNEVAASVRDTIWHWKEYVFIERENLEFEELVRSHTGLIMCIDAITGPFNYLIDSILVVCLITWLTNTYQFYKEYIQGYYSMVKL